MKKLFILFLLAIPSMVSAQLLVNSDGNVGIGDSINAMSQIAVGDTGSVNETFFLKSNVQSGLKITRDYDTSYTSSNYNGLSVVNIPQTNHNTYGISIVNNRISNTSTYDNIGVYSYNCGNTNGRHFGVYGRINTSTGKGAAIVGRVSNESGESLSVDAKYAGYFIGNVKVTNGTINGTLVSDSDEELKENIVQLEDRRESVLASLENLNPVCYNYKMLPIDRDDNASENDPNFSESLDNSNLSNEEIEEREVDEVNKKTHFGFIAQELQQVYPELVYENDNGTLSVCYVELIPILVQSIKELNAKVEALQEANGYAKANFDDDVTAIGSPLTDAGTGMASMSQNMPNPFTDTTDIPIYLPESVNTATLCIYDLTGKQIEQYAVTGRGQTTMTIHADRMAAGMYLYALIADGKVVTSKRMIVSK